MVYAYVFGGIYILVSLVLFSKWAIQRIKMRRIIRDVEEAEEKDPFFDKFYPHF